MIVIEKDTYLYKYSKYYRLWVLGFLKKFLMIYFMSIEV